MAVVKKEPVKKPVKKAAPAEKKTAKPDLKQFLGEIEKKAYEIFLERKKAGISGDEMSDWIQAEKAIKAKYKI
jgi:hypothetical protein